MVSRNHTERNPMNDKLQILLYVLHCDLGKDKTDTYRTTTSLVIKICVSMFPLSHMTGDSPRKTHMTGDSPRKTHMTGYSPRKNQGCH